MILQQYDITLRRINQSDIEEVRVNRNKPEVRYNMGYQKIITPKAQQKWFSTIDNKLNYYFIIEVKGKRIGLINVKEVNESQAYAEGGIFIWDEEYRGTPYPVFASLVLMDFIFCAVEFGSLSFVRVLKKNKLAIRYNEQLGYVVMPVPFAGNVTWMVLSKTNYEKKAKILRKAAKAYTKTSGEPTYVTGDPKKQIDAVNAFFAKQH